MVIQAINLHADKLDGVDKHSCANPFIHATVDKR